MDDLGEPQLAAARERQRTARYGLGVVYVGPADRRDGYDGWSGMFAVSDGTNELLALASVPSLPGFQSYSPVAVDVAASLLEDLGSRVDNELPNRAAGLVALGTDEHGINLKRYCVTEDLARLLPGA